MRGIIKVLFPLLLLISITVAADNSAIYQDYGIKFSIPENWSVEKVDQLTKAQPDGTPINDTKIVLSDGYSAIRIDIIELPEMRWLMQMYNDVPWAVTDILESLYRTNIIKVDKNIRLGGGSEYMSPDDVKSATFRFGPNGDLKEWSIAFSKPEYGNDFIGVHALFPRSYPEENISNFHIIMPTPLYEILSSFEKKDSKTGLE